MYLYSCYASTAPEIFGLYGSSDCSFVVYKYGRVLPSRRGGYWV